MNDILKELPKGWVKTSVGEISDKIHYGYTASADFKDVGPKLLRITDIQENKVDWDTVPNCKIDKAEKEKFLLSENDLVFARTGATVGKSFLIKADVPKAVFASYLIRIKLNPSINPNFIYCYFQSGNYWRQISDSKLGIGQPNVNATILSNLSLPLPPLPEQHRIVAKIEELFTKLDVSVAELKKAKAQIKRYRQSVLKHAFEGKLTEQWRIANCELRNETAEELLAKIKEERKKALNKKYKELPPVDTTNLPHLPDGWVWSTIGEIETFVGSGVTPKGGASAYSTSGIPFIRSQNVYPNVLLMADIVFISETIHSSMSRSRVFPNDVLLNITGASIGRCTVVPDNLLDANVNQHVCIIRSVKMIAPKYLSMYLNSPLGQSSIMETQGGVTRQGLNYEQLRSIPFPLTNIPEQSQIVSEIERHFSVADETEKIIDQSLKQAERLRQSILKEAFSGKLIPQDPNDPPASLLLEKIKAERATLDKGSKPKRRTSEPAERKEKP